MSPDFVLLKIKKTSARRPGFKVSYAPAVLHTAILWQSVVFKEPVWRVASQDVLAGPRLMRTASATCLFHGKALLPSWDENSGMPLKASALQDEALTVFQRKCLSNITDQFAKLLWGFPPRGAPYRSPPSAIYANPCGEDLWRQYTELQYLAKQVALKRKVGSVRAIWVRACHNCTCEKNVLFGLQIFGTSEISLLASHLPLTA